MKSKIKFNFRKKIWRLKEEFKTSNRRNDTNQVVTIEAIIKKNNIIGRGESTPYYRYGEDINNSLYDSGAGTEHAARARAAPEHVFFFG